MFLYEIEYEVSNKGILHIMNCNIVATDYYNAIRELTKSVGEKSLLKHKEIRKHRIDLVAGETVKKIMNLFRQDFMKELELSIKDDWRKQRENREYCYRPFDVSEV